MLKIIATDVLVSKGYNGAPALHFSENGSTVRFRIGKKTYDARTESGQHWINFSVKAFGSVCERIKKMQLKESACINLMGRLDEDVWSDPQTHEKHRAMVIIVEEIEYCSSAHFSPREHRKTESHSSTQVSSRPTSKPTGTFTGYEIFDASKG